MDPIVNELGEPDHQGLWTALGVTARTLMTRLRFETDQWGRFEVSISGITSSKALAWQDDLIKGHGLTRETAIKDWIACIRNTHAANALVIRPHLLSADAG
jgi:hypothetical protein